jgi:transcriptional regulator GlxA family with amidase domain
MFEEATGHTPHRYLLHLRLCHAMELIRKRSMPLVDVAAVSGFSSQSHMSLVFRRLRGATPGQMRRLLKATPAVEDQTRQRPSLQAPFEAEPLTYRNHSC